MTNQFYVKPGNEYAPAMQDLQSTMARVSAQKRKEQAQQEYAAKYSEAMNIYRSGDPDMMAEFTLQNPKIGESLSGLMEHKNKRTKENYFYSMYKVLQDDSPANVQKVVENRKKVLAAEGVGPETSMDTDTFLQRYKNNPDAMKKQMSAELAVRDSARWQIFRKAQGMGEEDTRTPVIKNYEYAKGQGYKGSLLDFQSSGKDTTGSTTAIKEFEYGERNPNFKLAQQKKADAKNIKAVEKADFKDVAALRKEFLAQSSEFQKVRDSYTRVIGSTQDPSPAGDLSLIFNYMKMLDPGSVVRESEFATAAAAGSYGDRIQASVQKVISGERLTPKMRADFVKKSGELYKGMQKQHKKREGSYRQIATDNQFSPDEVVIDITAPAERPTDVVAAPESAEAYLKQNPSFAQQFKEKYGYLPEGN